MILLTKIDGEKIVINADEIETIQITHNSIVGLKSGRKFIVQENHEEIIRLFIEFKQKCQPTQKNIEVIFKKE